MVEWDESYSTGDVEIDRQHKRLFDQINNIEKAIKENKTNKIFVRTTLGFLGDYCKKHFGFEEDCMTKRHCPVAEKNKLAHDKFMELFQSYKNRFENDEDPKIILQEIYDTSTKWLVNHICKIDTHLRSCKKV